MTPAFTDSYYHNDATGETTWSKPASMKSNSAGQSAAAAAVSDGDPELMAVSLIIGPCENFLLRMNAGPSQNVVGRCGSSLVCNPFLQLNDSSINDGR